MTENLENDLIRVRTERDHLIRTCVMLAAPLCMATDGTAASAVHHITTYVESLKEGEPAHLRELLRQWVEHYEVGDESVYSGFDLKERTKLLLESDAR